MNKIFLILSFLTSVAYSQKAQDIDALFEEYKDTPGAVVGVFKDGEIVFKKGYGIANMDYGIELSPTSVLDIASNGKQFTAAAITLLEIEGKLNFDDPIRKYLPDFPEYPGNPITINHLIHHTSGIRDYIDLIDFSGQSWDNKFSKEEILETIFRQPRLNFEPGGHYDYCNSGYLLLGRIVEQVSGQSFANFIDQRLFKPLGMSNSLIYDNNNEIIPNRAIGYRKYKNGIEMDHDFNVSLSGDGQLLTNVIDFKKWDDNYTNNKLGDRTFLEKMFRKGVLNNGDTIGYAGGIFREEYQGFETIEHSGSWAGFRSYYAKIPKKNLAVVVFSNFAEMNAIKKGRKILDILLNIPSEENSKDIREPENQSDFNISVKDLKKYAGMYWNDRFLFSQNIYISNDTLRQDKTENTLNPVSTGKFLLNNNKSKVFQFSKNNDSINQIYLKDGDWELEFEAFTPVEMPSDFKKFLGEYYSEALKSSISIKQENIKFILYKNGRNYGEIFPKKENEYYVNFFGTFSFDHHNNLELSTRRLKNVIFNHNQIKS
ncbi:serine hydrolase [Gramella sp. KN1008]|uniref:serine hydrolase domain-containing protein n=1 Tax=Gramella sp. KN1008 TaxID=2529298 RepID=UPI0010407FDE|nr:serine hydrolase domain-containing protein [Gramella sp. KN1008]TBW26554.1 class A beta-lactamase-related serine hydrolase [Gramella sp. KN1008]